jgi:hypothetical protein
MIIWLASYPKSGNTWLRFFIISLLAGDKDNINLSHLKAITSFPTKSQFEGLVKDFKSLVEVAKNWQIAQKKINFDKKIKFLKTHNMLNRYKNSFFTDNENTLGTIYIARDPRNIITSLKNHFSYTEYDEAKKFLFNENQAIVLSNSQEKKIKNQDNFQLPQFVGSWQTHYKSWKNMKKNLLLIKYENLIKTPDLEFVKIAKFLEKMLKIRFTKEQIEKSIYLSSFDKLQKMEEKKGFIESTENKLTGQKNKFFYLGPKNDWRKILDKEIADEISSRFEPEMKELGYL